MATVFITGTNKGLGYEFVRQYLKLGYKVIATCRNIAHADNLNNLSSNFSDKLKLVEMDLNDVDSVKNLSKTLKSDVIDIFISNAATNLGYISNKEKNVFGAIDEKIWIEVLKLNCVMPLMLAQQLKKNILQGVEKKIIFMSAKTASIEDNISGGMYMNRSTRTALNQVVKSLSIDLEKDHVNVLAMSPGWVKTDSGGKGALIDVKTSVDGMINVISKLTRESSGSFMDYKGEIIPW
ncbi:MAG: hypothetical protein CML63_08605 [Rhodobacteraceae bacterium]|nr:hypothetical protein [Paracoccaceae bacterium]